MDKNTIENLGLNYLIDILPFRKKNLNALNKFIFKDENSLIKHYKEFKNIIDKYGFDEIDKLITYLSDIDDIIIDNQTALTVEYLFIVKKSIYYWLQIQKDFHQLLCLLHMKQPNMNFIWNYLGGNSQPQPVFHLKDLADKEWICLYDEITQLNKKIEKLKKRNRAAIELKWNVSLKNDFYSFSNCHEKELIQCLLSSGDFFLKEKNHLNSILIINEEKGLEDDFKNLEELNQKLIDKEKELLSAGKEFLLENCYIIKNFNLYMNYLELISVSLYYYVNYNCVIPDVGNIININNGRYLPLENEMNKKNSFYQPLDFSTVENMNIFTGMNMGGKSICIKTIGFLGSHLLFGLPVPSRKLVFPFFHDICFMKGVSQEKNGLSAFATEMTQLNVLFQKKRKDFIYIGRNY